MSASSPETALLPLKKMMVLCQAEMKSSETLKPHRKKFCNLQDIYFNYLYISIICSQGVFIYSNSGFLNFSIIGSLDQIILYCATSPVLGGMFSSFPDLYMLYTITNLSLVKTTKKYLQTLPSVPGRANFLLVEIHCLTV